MDRGRTRYQITEETEQSDGSVFVRVRKQYNDKADVSKYVNWHQTGLNLIRRVCDRNCHKNHFYLELGQFTRNYTQTVKRAADNKRRYAPGEGSIPPVLLSGVSKGVPPLAHDFACKV